jgi:hypothetical protein
MVAKDAGWPDPEEGESKHRAMPDLENSLAVARAFRDWMESP